MTIFLLILTIVAGLAYMVVSMPHGADKCVYCGGDLWMRNSGATCVKCGRKQ